MLHNDICGPEQVVAVHYLDWTFRDWLTILYARTTLSLSLSLSLSLPPSLPPSHSLLYARGFANQVASLQDVAAVEERQTLHFAFAGADGVMQKDEFRRRENFAKFMSRVLIGAKCQPVLEQTRCGSVVVRGNDMSPLVRCGRALWCVGCVRCATHDRR